MYMGLALRSLNYLQHFLLMLFKQVVDKAIFHITVQINFSVAVNRNTSKRLIKVYNFVRQRFKRHWTKDNFAE